MVNNSQPRTPRDAPCGTAGTTPATNVAKYRSEPYYTGENDEEVPRAWDMFDNFRVELQRNGTWGRLDNDDRCAIEYVKGDLNYSANKRKNQKSETNVFEEDPAILVRVNGKGVEGIPEDGESDKFTHMAENRYKGVFNAELIEGLDDFLIEHATKIQKLACNYAFPLGTNRPSRADEDQEMKIKREEAEDKEDQEMRGEDEHGETTNVEYQGGDAENFDDGKKHLVLCSPPDSGKTLAYLIVSEIDMRMDLVKENRVAVGQLEDVYGEESVYPSVLIIVPTHDLGDQVYKDIWRFVACTGVRVGKAIGGYNAKNELRELARGCDYLVGTPGRLREYVQAGVVSLRRVSNIVLDNVESMWFDKKSMRAQINDILKTIDDRLFTPESPRLMFVGSGCTVGFVQGLADELLLSNIEGIFVASDLNGYTKSSKIQHEVVPIWVERDRNQQSHNNNINKAKFQRLVAGLEQWLKSNFATTDGRGNSMVMVFVDTKETGHNLVAELKRVPNLANRVGYLNSDITQIRRRDALEELRKSTERLILISTDVGKAGLDLDISLVINFDFPSGVTKYIDRAGRAGRVQKGRVVSFVAVTREHPNRIKGFSKGKGNPSSSAFGQEVNQEVGEKEVVFYDVLNLNCLQYMIETYENQDIPEDIKVGVKRCSDAREGVRRFEKGGKKGKKGSAKGNGKNFGFVGGGNFGGNASQDSRKGGIHQQFNTNQNANKRQQGGNGKQGNGQGIGQRNGKDQNRRR